MTVAPDNLFFNYIQSQPSNIPQKKKVKIALDKEIWIHKITYDQELM